MMEEKLPRHLTRLKALYLDLNWAVVLFELEVLDHLLVPLHLFDHGELVPFLVSGAHAPADCAHELLLALPLS